MRRLALAFALVLWGSVGMAQATGTQEDPGQLFAPTCESMVNRSSAVRTAGSSAASDCDPTVRHCDHTTCRGMDGDEFECCDIRYEECAIVDEQGTEVCYCIPEGIKFNCESYSCEYGSRHRKN